MKILLVDFHAGCLQALALSLEACGAEVKILSLSGHNFIFDSADLKRWSLSRFESLSLRLRIGLINRDIKSASRLFLKSKKRGLSLRPRFDLAISMFPPALALGVYRSGVAHKTVMLAAHRADLWIQKPNERKNFWLALGALRADKTANFEVYAASKFDSNYISSLVEGFFPEVLELPAPHITAISRIPATSKMILGFGLDLLSPDSRSRFLSSLPHPVIDASVALPGRYGYEELMRYPAFAYVPYSSYSIKLLELELTGRPIFVPPDRDLTESNALNDVRLWPIYGDKSEITSFDMESPTHLNQVDNPGFLALLENAQWKNSASITQDPMRFTLMSNLSEEVSSISNRRISKLASTLKIGPNVIPETLT